MLQEVAIEFMRHIAQRSMKKKTRRSKTHGTLQTETKKLYASDHTRSQKKNEQEISSSKDSWKEWEIIESWPPTQHKYSFQEEEKEEKNKTAAKE